MAAIEFAAVNDDAIRSASDKVSVAADDSWALFAAYWTISALLFVHKKSLLLQRRRALGFNSAGSPTKPPP
jgi:hypothetical protein